MENVKNLNNNFGKFMEGHKSQWIGGGKRYAFNNQMEFTDLVCEEVGNNWILGNILKYAGENWNAIRNKKKPQEVNFIKIAVYSFILWIKEFKQRYTTVEAKKKHYQGFEDRLWSNIVMNYDEETINKLRENNLNLNDFTKNIRRYIWSIIEKENLLLGFAELAFYWWLANIDNFTQRDEGEEL